MNDDKTEPAGRPDTEESGPRGLLGAGMGKLEWSGAGPQSFDPPDPVEVEKLVTGYTVSELLGRGGMGCVYKARENERENLVAIKLLPPELGVDPVFAQRFLREADTMAKLDHPNIVQVHRDGTTAEGHLSAIMELVDGADLQKLLQSGGLTPAQAVEIFIQLCRPLEYAHKQGVVHRDLKPANVLLTKDGIVKLTDFGLAKLLHGDGSSGDLDLTLTGAAMGTPLYMSPEQRTNTADADHRADIYSLGVLFYQMLTGELPVGNFEAPSDLVPIDARLDDVIKRAMAPDRTKRFQTVADFRQEITSIRDSWKVSSSLGDAVETTARGVLRVVLRSEMKNASLLAEREGAEKFAAIIERFHSLFRQALKDTGAGSILQPTDGGFVASFDHPGDAVRAALRFQHGLREEHWTCRPEPEVRLALSSGELVEAISGDGDTAAAVGPAMNEAGRLLQLGLASQLLLTERVFEEARQSVNAHPCESAADGDKLLPLLWKEHGRYAFRGLDDPMRVFEVGVVDISPLTAPPGGNRDARRAVSPDEEDTLGWRPAAGQPIPRRPGWILLDKLGEGGFGEVWRGVHEKTRDVHVYKFCFDPLRLRSFRREITIFRLLRDALGKRPDVGAIYEVQVDTPPFFLESEYYELGNLREWAQRHGGLDQIALPRRMDILSNIARALAAAHALGIIHKDVKPTNVLMTRGVNPDAPEQMGEDRPVRPVLVDFGIGALADPAPLSDFGITMAGFTRSLLDSASSDSGGTRLYAPPEYQIGGPPSMQGDLYALGVMLYQMTVGDFDRPLGSGWERDIEDPVLRGDIAACVDVDPTLRLGSAREFAERVQSLEARRAERRESEERTALEAKQKKTRRLVLAGSVVLFVLAALAGWFALHEQERAQREENRAQRLAKTKQTSEKLIADLLFDLGGKLEDIGRTDLLDSATGTALDYFENLPVEDRNWQTERSHSQALRWRSDVLRTQGKTIPASRLLEDGVVLARGALSANPEDGESLLYLAKALTDYAEFLHDQNLLEKSEEAYNESLELLARASAQADNEQLVLSDTSRTLNLLGDLQMDRSNLDGAKVSFLKAHDINSDLFTKNKGESDFLSSLIVSMGKLAYLAEQTGDHEVGMKWREEAVDLAKENFAADKENALYRERLATSLLNFANLQTMMNEGEKARESYDESARHFEHILRDDPEDQNIASKLANVSMSLGLNYWYSQDIENADKSLQRARDMFEGLVEAAPDNLSRKESLLVCLNRIVAVQKKRQQFSDAKKTLTRCLQLMKIISAANPGDPAYMRKEALLLMDQADLLFFEKQAKEARLLYDEALALCKKRRAMDRENQQAAMDLVICLGKMGRLVGGMPLEENIAHLDQALAVLRELNAAGKLSDKQKIFIPAFEKQKAKLLEAADPAPEE